MIVRVVRVRVTAAVLAVASVSRLVIGTVSRLVTVRAVRVRVTVAASAVASVSRLVIGTVSRLVTVRAARATANAQLW